eukprot:780404-Karenia_brevis.AAC.1
MSNHSGGSGPPNSPLGSDVEGEDDQYGPNMVAEPTHAEGSLEDKMLKMVSATVKGLISELLPQLLKSQQETKRTADEKKGKLEEKYFRRIDKFSGEVNQFRTWMFNIK